MVLELAILGLLHESPLHGYELKKRLDAVLGRMRAFSYGSLYPALARMEAQGWVTRDAAAGIGRRSKVVYQLTADGKERFQELLAEGGPSQWDDEAFGVHMAFFAQTDAGTRLRILEGRRSRLEEQHEGLAARMARARERLDRYTLALQEHGLESVERELRWLNELIAGERADGQPAVRTPRPRPAGVTAGAAAAITPGGPVPATRTRTTGHITPGRTTRS